MKQSPASEIYVDSIRKLIGQDRLDDAIAQLGALLENSPQLDEAILQSARLHDIRRNIRRGTISQEEVNLTHNQIRLGLMELLREIETQRKKPAMTAELERAVSIINSKNVVFGSTITATNITIGDTTTITESTTSLRLRFFLLFFVPVLALALAFAWYRVEKLQTPLWLTVAVDNRTPNPELPFEGGSVTLQYGEKSETLPIRTEVDFKNIPASFDGELMKLRFETAGFRMIDTTITFSIRRLTLPIRHDESLGHVFGTVTDSGGNPLAGVQVRIQDLTSVSGVDGKFSIDIPFDKQRKKQRVSAFLSRYSPWEYDTQVLPGEALAIVLQKRK